MEKHIQQIISDIRPLIELAIQGEQVHDIKWTNPYTNKTGRVFAGNLSIMLDSWLMQHGYISEYGRDDLFYDAEVSIEETLSSQFPMVKGWFFSSVLDW